MKFEISQKNLNNCLKDISAFTGSQPDILKNILLKVSNSNLLEISATNLQVSIIKRVVGSSKNDEHSIMVPAGLLRDYVQNLSEENITIESKDGKKLLISTKSKSTTTEINGMPSETFPTLPKNKKDKPILKIKAGALKTALSQVTFATNKDAARPILTAVLLQVYQGAFYLVATDSYRLSEKQLLAAANKPKPGDDGLSILIPWVSLSLLERVLTSHMDSEIQVFKQKDEKHIAFIIADGEIEITSSLEEGVYPDYRKLPIPTTFDASKVMMVVDRQGLLGAVNRTSLFSKESSNSVILDWSLDNSKLITIKSNASQSGSSQETIGIKKITTPGKDRTKDPETKSITISFNGKFLKDVLSAFNDPFVYLNFNGNLDACLVGFSDSDKNVDSSYRHAIMPLKS